MKRHIDKSRKSIILSMIVDFKKHLQGNEYVLYVFKHVVEHLCESWALGLFDVRG